jgi:hypothetical protein
LAQRFAGDLAISAEVHATDHEADRLASTKRSACYPAWRPGNIHRIIQATSVQRLGSFRMKRVAERNFPEIFHFLSTAANEPRFSVVTHIPRSRVVRKHVCVQSVTSPCPRPVCDRNLGLSVSKHNPRSRSVHEIVLVQSRN